PSHTPDESSIPPLQNGDRLTRDEFDRRYNAMPSVKKAELIESIVYISSPDSYPIRSDRRNGAREYVVWRVRDGALDWFVLREGGYDRLMPGEDGLCRSEVFPGLWLDPAALLRGDMTTVFAAVRRGVDSPEHAAFVERLRRPEAPR